MKQLYKKIRYLMCPKNIILYFMNKGILDFLNDELYLKLRYRIIFKKKLNLTNPNTFNEKIQWLKLNERNPEYTKMVDKCAVKNYVSNNIGSEYIIPTIGTYEKFEDIDFERLPNKFVIKCNHDSGGIVICKDKQNIDYDKAKKKINKHLKRNMYNICREWPYRNVKPRILIEEYLEDEEGKDLNDYKVLCFNDKAKLIELHADRYTNHTQDFYDINWNKTEIRQGPSTNKEIAKPKNLNLMIELSEKLARGMKHVRIDWYEVKDKLFFSEITFYDGGGFEKFDLEQYDKQLGDLLILK